MEKSKTKRKLVRKYVKRVKALEIERVEKEMKTSHLKGMWDDQPSELL